MTRSTRRRLAAAPEPANGSSSPDQPDLDEVRAFAEELPERFLQCRDLMHNWLPFDIGRHPQGGYERTLRCARCKTRKVQHVTTDGLVLGGRYEHPDGYLREGLGRMTGDARGMLRVVSMQRSFTTRSTAKGA